MKAEPIIHAGRVRGTIRPRRLTARWWATVLTPTAFDHHSLTYGTSAAYGITRRRAIRHAKAKAAAGHTSGIAL